MLLIVAHHFVVNSGLTDATGPLYTSGLNWRTTFLLIFGAWGKIGINCFVFITGYFMCTAKISVEKFFKLVFQVLFYWYIINFVFWLTGYERVSVRGLASVLIPFRDVSTDFVVCFLWYYLTIPFLNHLIYVMDEKEHKRLIILSLLIYTLYGTIPFYHVRMNYVSWFIVLHFIASYIRLNPRPICSNVKFLCKSLLFLIAVDIVSVLVCYEVGLKIGKNRPWFFVTDSNTLLALLTGLVAFMFFKQINVKKSNWINLIASSTFGVLLIHANSDTMRRWLWKDVVDVVGHYDSPVLIPYAIGCVILIFGICVVIDLLRQHYIEPIYMKICFIMVDKVSNLLLVK